MPNEPTSLLEYLEQHKTAEGVAVEQYSNTVSTLFKTEDFAASVEPLLHAAVGISGEAGELLDCVKKAWAYKLPLDTNNLVEEMGDLEFYMEGLRQQLGITRGHVLNANVNKLRKRYPNLTYSDKHAELRLDKAEEVTNAINPKTHPPFVPTVMGSPLVSSLGNYLHAKNTNPTVNEIVDKMISEGTAFYKIVEAGPVFSFSLALEFLKNGEKVARQEWRLEGRAVKTYVVLAGNNEFDFMQDGSEKRGYFSFASDDILADDWVVVRP